jgi:hypothetical protein
MLQGQHSENCKEVAYIYFRNFINYFLTEQMEFEK